MGAPTLDGLTTMEAAAVGHYITSAKLGVIATKAACVRAAGYCDPGAQASAVFARPRVQATLRHLLDTLPIKRKCSRVLRDGLEITDADNPVLSQRERRHTVETIAKLTGELSDAGSVADVTGATTITFVSVNATLPRDPVGAHVVE